MWYFFNLSCVLNKLYSIVMSYDIGGVHLSPVLQVKSVFTPINNKMINLLQMLKMTFRVIAYISFIIGKFQTCNNS